MSSNTPSFQPTPEMIRAAELLFVAMAHEAVVREQVHAYEDRIITEQRYTVCADLRAAAARNGVELPERVDSRAQMAYLSEECFADFHARCLTAGQAIGLIPSPPYDCPLIEAEAARRMAEDHVLDCMDEVVPGAGRIKKATTELRAKAMDLSLKLLVPYVRRAGPVLDSLTPPMRLR